MGRIESSMDVKKLFHAVVFANIISMSLYLGETAYLGTFTRYMSDDYCEVALFQSGNVLDNLLNRYLTVSDRFSNILFIGLTELLGPHAVRVLPFIMIALWLIGLIWLLSEVNQSTDVHWPRKIIVYLALVVAFITAVQAPNQYQIFYWRSGMATHFAPLVFLGFLIAYLLMQLRRAGEPSSSFIWPLFILLFVSFMVSGFSEPPAALIIVGLGMALLYVWFMIRNQRPKPLAILFSAFLGASLALLVMALAPANSLRLENASPPSLPVFVERSFRFAIQFVVDWFRVVPLPALFTVIASFMVSLGQNLLSPLVLTHPHRRRVVIVLLAMPLLSYLLIVASFAPSVYGQSFPVERARFAGQLILVILLMVEGAGLGTLLADRITTRRVGNFPLSTAVTLLLVILAIYPLRAALLSLRNAPEYQARAAAWDERETQIRTLRAQGETDLTIVQFDGIDGVKELDVDPNHWINQCAATYYDVNSIRAISVKNP